MALTLPCRYTVAWPADSVKILTLNHRMLTQAEASSVRSEPLGYDRHWNRYWLLDCSGHDKLGECPVHSLDVKTFSPPRLGPYQA